MAFFDMPLNELQAYKPEREEAADFDAFWQATLQESRAARQPARFEPYEAGLRLLEVFDVTYSGYAGQPIKGWLLLPRHRSATEKLPCVVEYIGYGGGRGYPIDWLLWASAGYAHFVMDTRGQGSSWRPGDTADIEPEGSNPQYPGFMTRGILNPQTYYYRRVITDAVLAVETARTHPAINPAQVAVNGGSQGGGLAIAVSGLVSDLAAVITDVPFLCQYRRATEITDGHPYKEIALYCKTHREKVETVFNTLSYFDGVNFAARAKNPALFSVALMDQICPPSTVFAAYNHYQGPKEIKVWPYNGHEGGEVFQSMEKIKFLAQIFS